MFNCIETSGWKKDSSCLWLFFFCGLWGPTTSPTHKGASHFSGQVLTNDFYTLFAVIKVGIIFQPLQWNNFISYKQGHYFKPILSASASQQGPDAFKSITACAVESMQIRFHVLPHGSNCVQLSGDLNITVHLLKKYTTVSTMNWSLCMSNNMDISKHIVCLCVYVYLGACVCICHNVCKMCIALLEKILS